MQEHIKKHDLRDDIHGPKVAVPQTPKQELDEPARALDTGTLVTPDKGVVTGQTTHM